MFPWRCYIYFVCTLKVDKFCLKRQSLLFEFYVYARLRPGSERAYKIPPREKGETRRGEFFSHRLVSPFSREVIFTRTRVSLALLSLSLPEEKWGLLVV